MAKKKAARPPASLTFTSGRERVALSGGRYCTLVLRCEASPLTAAVRAEGVKAIKVEISLENFVQLEVPIHPPSDGGGQTPTSFCFELPLPLGPERFSGHLDPTRHLSLNPGAVASAAAALFEECRQPPVGSFFWNLTMSIAAFASGVAARGLAVKEVRVDGKFMSMRATSAEWVAGLEARIRRQHWCARPPARGVEERCAVCLEEITASWLRSCRLPCGHEYHIGCITPWLERKNSCPLCRSQVSGRTGQKPTN